MATGGYQAPSFDDTPTGFGNDPADNHNTSGSNIQSAPLFGIDYKKWVR